LVVAIATAAYGVTVWRSPGHSDWPEDLDAARQAAARDHRPLLVQFSTAGCRYCAKMEREVLSRRDVIDQLTAFELVRLDAWDHEELSARLGVEAVPTFVVLDPQEQALARIEGFHPADEFKEFLHRAAAAFRTLRSHRP